MCVISRARNIGCKTGVGGCLDLWFFNFADVPVYTYNVTEEITGISDELDVYHYKFFPGQVSFDEKIVTSKENGTVYWEQTLDINMFTLTKEDRIELNNMARGLLGVFVRDNNNKIRLMGLQGGVEVADGGSKTGKVKGDMSGYNLVFKAEEAKLAHFVFPYTAVPFDNIVDIVVTEPA